ncbi:transposable element Tcb2 transposase [Trichonephila clavipes]|nr:transposable element Tcb2 transposase [Trichonephila clavipes]
MFNLSRAQASFRWCGVEYQEKDCQLRCRSRHLTVLQNSGVCRKKPRVVLGPVDPRDVIYTKTRLRTSSTDQSLRRPPHRQQTAALSAAIQAQAAPSVGAPVSSRTIRRHLDEGHSGSRFNLSSDDNRVRVWKPSGESLNPAFDFQRHTAPIAGIIIWGDIAYNTRPPLVLIRGTMTAQRYVHDMLQPHVLLLMQLLPGAIFQQDNARPHTARVSQDSLLTVTTFLGLPSLGVKIID